MITWYRLCIVNGTNDLTGRLVSQGQLYSYNRLIIVWQLNERFARISLDIRYTVLVDSVRLRDWRSQRRFMVSKRPRLFSNLSRRRLAVYRAISRVSLISELVAVACKLNHLMHALDTVRVSFDTLWMLTRSVQRFLVRYAHRLTVRFRVYRY